MEKIKKYAQRFGEIILPYLLCTVIMSAALHIYTDNIFDVYTALAAAILAALFAILGRLRKIKLGGVIYTVLLIAVCFTPNLFISGFENAYAFVQWFFSGAQAVATRASFAVAFTIFFGFFFGSVIYYFTQIVYRSAAVVLITLIPFALAVKAAASLPNYYPALLAALNLFIFIFYSRRDTLRNAKTSGNAALVAYTDFALAAVLLALLIPKPKETPYYEKFEAAMSVFQFGGNGETVLRGEYNEYSGNADDMLKGESKLLYIVSSSDPTYMKSQVFDIYDEESGRWKSAVDVNGSKSWRISADLLSYEKLSEAVSAAANSDPTLYEKYPHAKKLAGITETESFSIVYPQSFPAIYVLAPLRAKDVRLADTGAQYSARSDKGEIFTNMRTLPPDADYTVRYYSENVLYGGMLENGLCDVSFEDYGEFLHSAYLETAAETDGYNVLKAFCDEYDKADAYRKNTETAVSGEIRALAGSITDGLEYDWQKARAIERYFYNGNFLYSLAYEAPEETDTPEFFLFESKTGTCSDFATAYTLLARAAGLAVRYAEGFVPSAGETPQTGIYYIYTENAHAYPEVYLPGAGWVRFEPTIANLTAGEGGAENGGETDYLALFLTSAVVIIGAGIFMILIILTPKILENLFRIKIGFSDNGKAVGLLYNRHLKVLGARYGIDPLPLTPEEAAAESELHTGISLEPLAKPFSALCYGGKAPSDEERAAAYECYKAQSREMRKKRNGKRNKERK